MADSIDIVVTETPQALEDSITFTDGAGYDISNDSDSMCFYRLSAAAPEPDAHGHPLPPYRDVEFVFVAGAEKTWVWSRDPPATLVISELAE